LHAILRRVPRIARWRRETQLASAPNAERRSARTCSRPRGPRGRTDAPADKARAWPVPLAPRCFAGANTAINVLNAIRCVAVTQRPQHPHLEPLFHESFKSFSNVRSEQLCRFGIAGPWAPPKAHALHGHRPIVGVRPALDLLIPKTREIDRRIGRMSEFLASWLACRTRNYRRWARLAAWRPRRCRGESRDAN
jgi:hypothetical protein